MARPQKIGLDYFPMDCKPDKKINAVVRKFGAEGFGVLVSVFQHIYSEGYFIEWNEQISEDFSLELNVDQQIIDEIILFCVKRDVFNSNLFDSKKVLTSRGIQKRFIEATKRRSSNNNVNKYGLIGAKSTQAVELMHTETPLKEVNDDISTQSKVKKSKVKKITYKDWDRDSFWDELLKISEEGKYASAMIESFYTYWAEETPEGKMRLQLNKTWSTGGRLSTWSRNNSDSQGSFNSRKHESEGQVLRKQGEIKTAPFNGDF